MAPSEIPGPCRPLYRTQSALALLDPQDHVRELADWVERIPATPKPLGDEAWNNIYSWLRLASGLRTVTFDMAYEDSGMCAAGDNFDYLWSEIMNEWQLHQVRLGYVRAAVEALVRIFHPDLSTPVSAIEIAETRLAQASQKPPLHTREVTQHFLGHATGANEVPTSLAVSISQAIGIHKSATQGVTRIPQPEFNKELEPIPAGYEEICLNREATSILLLGAQTLLIWAVEEKLIQAPNEDKFLMDGMWVPVEEGDKRWVDEEISYDDYLGVLQLDHGEPPEL